MKINNLTADKLRKSILQLAIQGKLVKQNSDDEPASELVKKIYAEKQKLIAEGKIKKDKTESYIYKGEDNRYYEKKGKNEPVDITDDLPFDIPDSWTFIRQVNTCWLDNGIKSFGEKLPYLEAKVIRGLKQPEYYNSGVKVTPKQKVILVDGENSGEILTPPFEGYMGSTFKIFSATSKIYYKYLLLFFELNKDTYKNSKKGAAIPHLNKDLFKSLYLPLPPLAEQQRIVEKIESIEPYLVQYDKIEKQLTKLETEIKDKLKKSILQYAIQGKLVKQDPNDEPASVLLEKIKAEKEQLIKEGKIKRDKNESFIYKGDDKNYYEKNVHKVRSLNDYLFDLPKKWEWCSLSNLSKLITDGTHKTPNYIPKGIPFLSVQNISSGKFDLTKLKYISKNEHLDLIKRCKPIINDILICRIGTLGKPIINNLNFDFSIFVSLGLVRLIDSDIVNYVKLILESPFTYNFIDYIKVGGGTHTFKINIEDMGRFPIPLAPIKEQQRILNKVNSIFNIVK